MYNTYNMGIGFVVCVDKDDVEKTCKVLEELGEKSHVIGFVEAGGTGICIK